MQCFELAVEFCSYLQYLPLQQNCIPSNCWLERNFGFWLDQWICSNMWYMYLNIRTDHWWPSQTAQVVNSPGESQWPRPFQNFVMTSRNPNDRDFWMSSPLNVCASGGCTGPIIDSFLTWDSECGNIWIIDHGYICWRTVYRLTNVRMSHRWAGWGRVGRGGVGGVGGGAITFKYTLNKRYEGVKKFVLT